MELDLPKESKVYLDAAYNGYDHEDFLLEETQIELIVDRKNNSKRPHTPWHRYLLKKLRKRIETIFSSITSLFPKVIHAATSAGFEIKNALFIAAFALSI